MTDTGKIRITYLIDSIGAGGAQTHVLNVLRNIDHDRFQVSVVCVRMPGSRFEQLESLPLETLVLNIESLTRPRATWHALRQLSAFIRAQRPQIMHAYLFNPTLLAGLYRFLHPFGPMLITSRRDVGYWHKPVHWWVYRVLNLATRQVVAVTEDVRRTSMCMEKIRGDKITTIYNGVDTHFYSSTAELRREARSAYGLTDEHLVIGILAILRPEKRHDIFIRAAASLASRFDHLRFLIVGGNSDDDWETRIREHARNEGIEDRVIFAGKVANSRPALAAFDISVLCSDTEGMSNTLLESIAMGLPVVATNVGGNPEVIEDGKSGILFPAGDADALATELARLIADDELRREYSQAARERALSIFSIEAMVGTMQDMYTSLLK